MTTLSESLLGVSLVISPTKDNGGLCVMCNSCMEVLKATPPRGSITLKVWRCPECQNEITEEELQKLMEMSQDVLEVFVPPRGPSTMDGKVVYPPLEPLNKVAPLPEQKPWWKIWD